MSKPLPRPNLLQQAMREASKKLDADPDSDIAIEIKDQMDEAAHVAGTYVSEVAEDLKRLSNQLSATIDDIDDEIMKKNDERDDAVRALRALTKALETLEGKL
jgi:gas vesicle protein